MVITSILAVIFYAVLAMYTRLWAANDEVVAVATKIVSSVPLDIFSAFAGVAAAIAIAYAGLDSFRYRIKIMDYVRKQLMGKSEKDSLLEPLLAEYSAGNAVCSNAEWATLYRLGDLGYWDKEVPEPGNNKCAPTANDVIKKEAGRGLEMRLSFIIYKYLFMTNVDKIISVALGIVSITIIWFATIDRWDFIDPKLSDVDRIKFFSGVFYFYIFLGLLAIVSAFRHKNFWPQDHLSPENEYRKGKAIQLVVFLGVVIVFWKASNNDAFFSNHLPTIQEDTFFDVTTIILMASVFIPSFFLVLGNCVTVILKHETDHCIKMLRALVSGSPRQAKEPVAGS
jgi:hypothetical protein